MKEKRIGQNKKDSQIFTFRLVVHQTRNIVKENLLKD